jgi:hypothetical protein
MTMKIILFMNKKNLNRLRPTPTTQAITTTTNPTSKTTPFIQAKTANFSTNGYWRARNRIDSLMGLGRNSH